MTVLIVNKELNPEKKPYFNCGKDSVFDSPFSNEQAGIDAYNALFYTYMNPDIAPPGFLENLEHMTNVAMKRQVRLGSDHYPERCHCEVIQTYLETEVRIRKKDL